LDCALPDAFVVSFFLGIVLPNKSAYTVSPRSLSSYSVRERW
jgi:hypothetical protein